MQRAETDAPPGRRLRTPPRRVGRQAGGGAPEAPPDDVADLVRAAAAGDQTAWYALVERFSALPWAVCRSCRLSASDAADVNQIVWLRLIEHLGRLRQPERLAGWLVTVTRRECLRVLTQRGREGGNVPGDLVDQGDGGEARLLAAERALAVRVALERIPPRCQALLKLLVADPGASYEDVSRALGMPVGSIGPTRLRCLEQLRRAMAVQGVTSAC
jgi:RNA polymerase sigma factor (sigma-70 family)